jgi:hypothetical protein
MSPGNKLYRAVFGNTRHKGEQRIFLKASVKRTCTVLRDVLGLITVTDSYCEMWCWRRMKTMIGTDHVNNEEAIKRGREENKFLLKIERTMDNWTGHILRRNGLLKHVTE